MFYKTTYYYFINYKNKMDNSNIRNKKNNISISVTYKIKIFLI